MKRAIVFLVVLAFSGNATFPAKDPSFLHKVVKTITFPLSPTEVSHEWDITRSNNDAYELDSHRIAQLQMMYEENFKLRSILAHATYAATATSLAWLGYKWGLFDWMLPTKLSSVVSTSLAASTTPLAEDSKKSAIIAYINARFKAIDEKKDIENGHWLLSGIKSVGWSGMTIAGSLIVQSKWYSFFNYVLAEPSFKWFLSNHNIISTIDRLKRSVQALSSSHMPAEFSQEYHTKSLVPTIESLIRNTEQFIAFIDFYLPLLSKDVVQKEAMDGISRYLFNVTNDFLKKMNEVLLDPINQSNLLPVIDEYRADLVAFINRCKVFEEEFFPAV